MHAPRHFRQFNSLSLSPLLRIYALHDGVVAPLLLAPYTGRSCRRSEVNRRRGEDDEERRPTTYAAAAPTARPLNIVSLRAPALPRYPPLLAPRSLPSPSFFCFTSRSPTLPSVFILPLRSRFFRFAGTPTPPLPRPLSPSLTRACEFLLLLLREG